MKEAEIQRAREHFRRGQWREAHDLLSLADRSTTLTAEDLGLLARSVYLLGRDTDVPRYFERAHQAHVEAADYPSAASWAFWLSLTALLRGDVAQSNGWLARGQRLIAGLDCVEQGYLLLPVAEQHLDERSGMPTVPSSRTPPDGEHYPAGRRRTEAPTSAGAPGTS